MSEGLISDLGRVRIRLRLGYPSWLALEELGPEKTEDVLSRLGGIPRMSETSEALTCDVQMVRKYGLPLLKARRWAPLVNGQIAVADPLGPLPEGGLAAGPLCLAPARQIDGALRATPHALEESAPAYKARRLGRYLLTDGLIGEHELALGLEEQARSGGRLGEVLLGRGLVSAPNLTTALAGRLGLPTLGAGENSVALLPRQRAQDWRAVALSDGRIGGFGEDEPIPIAFAHPDADTVEAVERHLWHPVEPKVTDEETLNALIAAAYAEQDVAEVTTVLADSRPHLSALRTKLSAPQLFALGLASLALIIGLILIPFFTAVVAVSLGTLFYVFYTLYRVYVAWQGWRGDSTISPSVDDLWTLDEWELPIYTVLLPVYKEKLSTMRALLRALENLDYPKHKVDGLLLVEEDDDQTREAVQAVGKPAWLKVLPIPPGEPRTKPKAMIYALRYTRGELLTIFDAEDQPDPLQLKKAVWGFREAADESVACLQAKLNYYNLRQNLLTRWFTLEYSAWFDLFLPGLHRTGAPIPLGGTSNHFRTDVLKESLSWDPYNVTEDADLGVRFARLGKKTMMLESTTYEEANSNLKNWIRQRSRWIKGYMQTFLVHTRHPLALVRDIGVKDTLSFMATFGGLIGTVLILPVFWALLALWIFAQPGWIPNLFPGPFYYMALATLFLGNFFFVFLGLAGAVMRGYDDLTPYTLLVPAYWLLMSVAGYVALYELIVKPHYWQKTEHGLHLEASGYTKKKHSEEIERDLGTDSGRFEEVS